MRLAHPPPLPFCFNVYVSGKFSHGFMKHCATNRANWAYIKHTRSRLGEECTRARADHVIYSHMADQKDKPHDLNTILSCGGCLVIARNPLWR